MASDIRNLSYFNPDEIPDASEMSFGLVISEYHDSITLRLRDAAIETLTDAGCKKENIYVIYVPGAYELTSGAQLLSLSEDVDAILCLGCVIKGDTDHDIYINNAVSQGLTRLSLDIKKPVMFGLLTPNTEQQAIDRAGGKHGNKGVEVAVAAIKMADIRRKLGV